MMLKLTIKDVLKQKSFGAIAIISGFLLGLVYYFLTLSSAVTHNLTALVVSPQYLAASIGLTLVVAVLGGINIALVVYNIKTQRMNLQKGGSSAIFGGALAAFTPGCPACTTSLTAVLGIVGGLAIFPLQGLELKFVSIAAPMARTKLMIGRLAAMGMIAGVPAIFGAWVGGFVYSPLTAVIFLAIGVGAIFQVIVLIIRWIQNEEGKLSNSSVLAGIAVGMIIMYITSILV